MLRICQFLPVKTFEICKNPSSGAEKKQDGRDPAALRISGVLLALALPLPVPDLRQVDAVVPDILAVLHQLVIHLLHQIGAPVAQLGQTAHGVDDQIEAVNVIEDPHIEGRGDGALLLVAPDMEVLVVAAVSQLMNQGGIAVIGEDKAYPW